MDYKEMYNQIKLNSLKKTKILKTNKKAKILSKTLILFIIQFYILNLYTIDTENTIKYDEIPDSNYSVSSIIVDNTVNIFEEMANSGIEYSDNLTPEDYKKIKTLDEKDLYSYYNCLGKVETEKVIIALGYDNWEDFLEKNNFKTIKSWVAYNHSKMLNNVKKR